jgi:uncharacterized cupredoxin-like copper-binding protein
MVAILFVAALLLGCSSSKAPGTVMTVGMQDLSFAPSTLALRKDEAVRLDLKNSAGQLHDFTVEKMSTADMHASGGAAHDMQGMDTTQYAVHLAVDGGKRAQLDFRPLQAGDYEFYCTVAGHREGGMRGTIHVE